jgi:hypothetical protein
MYKKNMSIASYMKELPLVEMVDGRMVQKSAVLEEVKEEVAN